MSKNDRITALENDVDVLHGIVQNLEGRLRELELVEAAPRAVKPQSLPDRVRSEIEDRASRLLRAVGL